VYVKITYRVITDVRMIASNAAISVKNPHAENARWFHEWVLKRRGGLG